MALTKQEVEIIAQIIEEEVEDKVLSALQDFATTIKEYIEESINENNTSINNHINNILNEVNFRESDSDLEEYDESDSDLEEYDESDDDYNDNDQVVTEQKQNIRESIRGMFENKQTEFRDSSNGESLKFKSDDLVRNQVSKAELNSLMPPDDGAYYDTNQPQGHTKSVLDIAQAIPDPSVANALTKDYSGLMKKLNDKK